MPDPLTLWTAPDMRFSSYDAALIAARKAMDNET